MQWSKAKEFRLLNAGEYFKWERKLYLKSDWSNAGIQVSNGRETNFNSRVLIIPVKVKITIIK